MPGSPVGSLLTFREEFRAHTFYAFEKDNCEVYKVVDIKTAIVIEPPKLISPFSVYEEGCVEITCLVVLGDERILTALFYSRYFNEQQTLNQCAE